MSANLCIGLSETQKKNGFFKSGYTMLQVPCGIVYMGRSWNLQIAPKERLSFFIAAPPHFQYFIDDMGVESYVYNEVGISGGASHGHGGRGKPRNCSQYSDPMRCML